MTLKQIKQYQIEGKLDILRKRLDYLEFERWWNDFIDNLDVDYLAELYRADGLNEMADRLNAGRVP